MLTRSDTWLAMAWTFPPMTTLSDRMRAMAARASPIRRGTHPTKKIATTRHPLMVCLVRVLIRVIVAKTMIAYQGDGSVDRMGTGQEVEVMAETWAPACSSP